MTDRSNVSPDTLSIELQEGGILVEYTDGREVYYHGAPEKREGSVQTAPGKHVQVLVTDPTETEGVMTYVNDRKTADSILEDSGVGRVLVPDGDSEALFPGVTVSATGHAVSVEADPDVARGRVFVFAEDEVSEQSYELV
jgi:hypothetical protein